MKMSVVSPESVHLEIVPFTTVFFFFFFYRRYDLSETAYFHIFPVCSVILLQEHGQILTALSTVSYILYAVIYCLCISHLR